MAAKVAKPNSAQQKNNVDAVSLQVSLPQMLDLALGTPEIGAVNLNILHNFLHVLLHLINLDSAKVEYRGDHANRLKMVVETSTKGPSLQLHEYNITDGSGKVKQRNVGKESAPSAEVYTEASKGTVSAPASARDKTSADNNSQMKTTKGVKQQIGAGAESDFQTVVFVEPVVDGVAPTALGFKQLDQSVKELQHRFQALEELQSNAELMERLKGKIADPLTDIWQVISINKRLDANEQGIDKLMSMVQDLAKTSIAGLPTESEAEEGPVSESTVSISNQQLNQRMKDVENSVIYMEQAISDLQSAIGQTPATTEAEEEPGSAFVKKEVLSDDENATDHGEVEQVLVAAVGTNETQTAGKTNAVKKEPGKQRLSITGGVNIVSMHGDVEAMKTEMAQIRTDIYDLNTKIEGLVSGKTEEGEGETTEKPAEMSTQENIATSIIKENGEETLAQFWEAIQNVEKNHSDDLNEVKNRLLELEKEMSSLIEKTEGTPMGGIAEDSDLNELVGKIQSIQSDMEKFNKIADRLIDDKEDRETHMNALLEQIELLKTIKADKEDLEDALADKADAQIVNRKVSHDQFDAACDDLARGLEDAVAKLGKQESIWQQALDEVQREIEGKVDKLEITPLKDFVSNRLKSLQDKLKKVADMNQETDAAGTKKILRDVQCISCDKNVVMKMEDPAKFHVDPLPCTMSMKPYLTYELDQVRKQQRRLPHSRNLHMFEAVMQEDSRKQKSVRDETVVKTPRDHLCNRYCGGSHTITTPQQRVMRMGHFLAQWGLETIQLTEGTVRGTEGQSYKCRTVPGKPDVCGSYYEGQETPKMDSERSSVQAPITQVQRKSQQSKRSSTASRRRRSRKVSDEPVAKEAPVLSVDSISQENRMTFDEEEMENEVA